MAVHGATPPLKYEFEMNEIRFHVTGFCGQFCHWALIESKIDSKVTTSSLLIPGYCTFRQDRSSNGGGVLTFIKDELKPTELSDFQRKFTSEGLEVTLVRVVVGKPIKFITFISLYRPPGARREWFTKLDEMILMLSTLGGSLILMGDINADLYKPTLAPASDLLKSLELAGHEIKKVFATRVTSNTATCLDIITCPQEIQMIDYSAIKSGASDHFPVKATILVNNTAKPQPIQKRSFRKVDMEDLKSKVADITIHQNNNNNESPEIMLNEWYKAVMETLDQVAPIKSYPLCRKKCKWMTGNIRALIQQRDSVARHNKDDDASKKLDNTRNYKRLKKIVKSRLRREAKNYGAALLAENNTREAWKFLREVSFTTTKGEKTTMDINIVNEHLARTVQAPQPSELLAISGCNSAGSFALNTLQPAEVLTMLRRLPARTSTGPDDLPASLLRQLAPAIAENLTTILNCCINQNIFPAQ